MLHGNGIAARLQSCDRIIASAGGARNVACVAIDIGYRDLGVRKHRAAGVKDNTGDRAGSDLRKCSSHI